MLGKPPTIPLTIIPRILPATCFSTRDLNPEGVVLHYVSAKYSAPSKWDDLETIRQQTIELNKAGSNRGPILPKSQEPRSYASYHLVIARDGQVYQFADFGKQVYHAGVSTWKGRENCNAWTYGVAFVAHETSGYTEEQYLACQKTLAHLRLTKHLPQVFGHDECAPGRKQDPGPKFDWSRVR